MEKNQQEKMNFKKGQVIREFDLGNGWVVELYHLIPIENEKEQ